MTGESLALVRAVRRVQGADSRRRILLRDLYAACIEVRAAVKKQHRGPRHAELRRAFGEGLHASPGKPPTVLVLAAAILSAVVRYPEAPRRAGIRPAALLRLRRLREDLVAVLEEIPRLRKEQGDAREAHGLSRSRRRTR